MSGPAADGPGHELEPVRPDLPDAIETSGVEPLAGPDQPVPNPLTSALDFNLSFPPIEVQMVNANALEDYETWLFAASLTGSACVGFAVATLQSIHSDSKGNLTVDFGLLGFTAVTGGLLWMFLRRVKATRARIKQGTKTVKMRASEVVDEAKRSQSRP